VQEAPRRRRAGRRALAGRRGGPGAASGAARRSGGRGLRAQALSKLREDAAVLKVREADLSLLKEVVEPARSKFQQARPRGCRALPPALAPGLPHPCSPALALPTPALAPGLPQPRSPADSRAPAWFAAAGWGGGRPAVAACEPAPKQPGPPPPVRLCCRGRDGAGGGPRVHMPPRRPPACAPAGGERRCAAARAARAPSTCHASNDPTQTPQPPGRRPRRAHASRPADAARRRRAQVFGKEAPSVTVDTKEFLPPAPKGSGDEEAMGRRARPPPPPSAACCAAPALRARPAGTPRPPSQAPGRHVSHAAAP
jgi:hypothetical protein